MSNRQNFSSEGKFERIVGYSRAVRIGNMIFVSGTSGVIEGFQGSDPYAQARRAIENIENVLKRSGASLQDVVRTRVFLTRGTDWKEVARAHEEFFGNILPASSMLVCEFLDPKILVEIEADAVVP